MEPEQVTVIPNLTVTSGDEETPVVPIRTTENSHNRNEERHNRNGSQNRVSRRAARVGQSVNFFLYGVTLMIPGIAMIVVYFVIFRIPAGNIKWSPADAFVITGAILVGFSIVSEVIGLWQFCLSRYESDDTPARRNRNNQYSDAPPPYDHIPVDLPDLVTVSAAQISEENPPSFESCYPNHRYLPGMENDAFDSNASDEEDFPPPPEYREAVKPKSTGSPSQSQVVISLDEQTGSVRIITSRPDSPIKSPAKETKSA